MRITELLLEAGSEGTITTASLGPANPTANLSPGPARGNKSFIGSPGKSGTKAPPQPKPKKQKPSDNALDGDSIFGQPLKR